MNSYPTLADVPWHHVRQVSGPRGCRVCMDSLGRPVYLSGPSAGTAVPLDAEGPWTRPWPHPQDDQ